MVIVIVIVKLEFPVSLLLVIFFLYNVEACLIGMLLFYVKIRRSLEDLSYIDFVPCLKSLLELVLLSYSVMVDHTLKNERK